MVRETLQGHDLLAVERFQDSTRHMIEFEVLGNQTCARNKGQKVRLFLSEEGYRMALDSQRVRRIRITCHGEVIEGHILYDKSNKKANLR